MKSFHLISRSFVSVACGAILFCGRVAAFAQVPGGGSAGMNSAMLKLFGSNTNFVSKAEVRVLDKSKNEITSMPMVFEMLAGRIRMDINLAQVKSREMSPEFAAQMKEMGMDQMTTVSLPDKKITLSIYPGLKAYAETPMPKDEAEALAKDYKIQKTRVAKETIDSHACEKNDVTLTDDLGNKQHATAWFASDLKDFPVQIQFTADDSTFIMKFKDVKLGRPDNSRFEAPAGLAKFSSINDLMSDAATKKANAAAK